MNEIVETSRSYLFTDLVLFICAMLAVVIGFIKRNKFAQMKYFYVYPLSSCLQLIVADLKIVYGYSTEWFPKSIDEISLELFLIVEFVTLFFFYKKVISRKLFSQIGTPLLILYSICFVVSRLKTSSWLQTPFELYYIQSASILLLAIIYLIDFFISPPKPSLPIEPSFIITIGTLIYFLGTLPIYIAKDFVFDPLGGITEASLFSINLICYSIFFLLITGAYLCKAPEKQ
jgi:hypothetical protein